MISCASQFVSDHRTFFSCQPRFSKEANEFFLLLLFSFAFSSQILQIFHFFNACTRLYQPLCRSVGPSVGPSVADREEHETFGDWPCSFPTAGNFDCLIYMYVCTVEPRYKGPAYKGKPDIKVNIFQYQDHFTQ